MDSELINISLKQGKQFNTYQKKIKKGVETVEKSKRIYTKKEGFTMPLQSPINDDENTDNLIQKRDERAVSIAKVNKAEQKQLTNLQTQYNDLQTQYNDTQRQLNNSSLESIKRTSPNNPYLNKNIRFTTGHICYVNNLGVVKWIPSVEIWDSLKNCSGKTYIDVNIPWLNEYFIPGTIIPTSPSLISGTNMVANQACGNEGKNVYVNRLVDNPSSSYVGCYNDKPAPTLINMVPIMNSSNSLNGFVSFASSVYQNNNNMGPWAAFDQTTNTFWHAGEASTNLYNTATGVYQGTNNKSVNTVNSGILTIKGEFLQINLPGVDTDAVQNMKVIQYSIAPRTDGNWFLTRTPNTWYLLGYLNANKQWYEVDRQIGQNFQNLTSKTYTVANPGNYGAYNIIVEKVGNDDQTTKRDTVQIAELNLFSSSEDSLTDSDKAMIYNSSSIGYTTFDDCKKYAVNNNYQYFGLQDLQSNGTAMCVVSNDYQKTVSYGDASKQVTIMPLWSSNTSTGQQYKMQVVGSGQITLYDMNNKAIFNTNDAVPDCVNWGTLIVDSATYGGNCKAPIGNVTSKVATDLGCNWKDSCSIPISNGTFGDPAPGCKKGFDIAYKCGGNSFSRNLTPAEGQTMILDCKDYMQTNCQFFLILQDDGNMCLYKGKDPSDQKDAVWCAMTNGKQKDSNPDWVASKGKYGRNYMKQGETLMVDEWIGSNDGTIKLIMQTDGDLVLYTSETKSGCSVKDDKTYGGSFVNAVYKIEPTGNKSVLGKVGYIDSDIKLKEYPSSLLSYSNKYQLLNDFDSAGNDITQVNPSSNNVQGCIDECNANGDCAGFVYQPNGNSCYLKNSAMYPSGEKQYYPNSGITLGVRMPQIGSSVNKACSRDIVNIDSIQYDNYLKGDPMSSETKCGTSIVLGEDKNTLTSLQNSMLSVGEQIADQTNNLYTKNQNIINTINQNSVQFNKNVDMYKANDNKIKSELNLPGRFMTETETKSKSNINVNKREGMRTIEPSSESDKFLTMNDVNSMLSDTDIRVLQENYGYIFWSILAVGLLTITVNQIKK